MTEWTNDVALNVATSFLLRVRAHTALDHALTEKKNKLKNEHEIKTLTFGSDLSFFCGGCPGESCRESSGSGLEGAAGSGGGAGGGAGAVVVTVGVAGLAGGGADTAGSGSVAEGAGFAGDMAAGTSVGVLPAPTPLRS